MSMFGWIFPKSEVSDETRNVGRITVDHEWVNPEIADCKTGAEIRAKVSEGDAAFEAWLDEEIRTGFSKTAALKNGWIGTEDLRQIGLNHRAERHKARAIMAMVEACRRARNKGMWIEKYGFYEQSKVRPAHFDGPDMTVLKVDYNAATARCLWFVGGYPVEHDFPAHALRKVFVGQEVPASHGVISA